MAHHDHSRPPQPVLRETGSERTIPSGAHHHEQSLCFDAFPFPEPQDELRKQVREHAERLDRLRKEALERDDSLTMTGIYNVIEKLRADEELTESERETHTAAACGVLRDLQDEIDRLVAKAYAWDWPLTEVEILDRLVSLHDERVVEEETGTIRWLRPGFQIPKFGEAVPEEPQLELERTEADSEEEPTEWPEDAVSQIGALKSVLERGPADIEELSGAFVRADRRLIRRHVETLELLGQVTKTPDGRYHLTEEPAVI